MVVVVVPGAAPYAADTSDRFLGASRPSKPRDLQTLTVNQRFWKFLTLQVRLIVWVWCWVGLVGTMWCAPPPDHPPEAGLLLAPCG
jgi:hypothetical protein